MDKDAARTLADALQAEDQAKERLLNAAYYDGANGIDLLESAGDAYVAARSNVTAAIASDPTLSPAAGAAKPRRSRSDLSKA